MRGSGEVNGGTAVCQFPDQFIGAQDKFANDIVGSAGHNDQDVATSMILPLPALFHSLPTAVYGHAPHLDTAVGGKGTFNAYWSHWLL